MSTFYEEAAMAHGAGNPTWKVTFADGLTGCERHIEVRAAEHQQAVNKATDRLNRDLSKPEGTYYFKRCIETNDEGCRDGE